MKTALRLFAALLLAVKSFAAAQEEGPSAALAFELQFRGEICVPGQLNCFPDAKGIPFAAMKHIIPMSVNLWKPRELLADFKMRMSQCAPTDRKKGIMVVLKTERCATKEARFCSVTTAALEKRSTPLAGDFEIYGLELLPRDGDNPPGSLQIETGKDAWKNDAAGEYGFTQGPGATMSFLTPTRERSS